MGEEEGGSFDLAHSVCVPHQLLKAELELPGELDKVVVVISHFTPTNSMSEVFCLG